MYTKAILLDKIYRRYIPNKNIFSESAIIYYIDVTHFYEVSCIEYWKNIQTTLKALNFCVSFNINKYTCQQRHLK